MKIKEEIFILLQSKYSLIWFETPDEDYAYRLILETASSKYTIYRWILTEGISVNNSSDVIYDSSEPIKALKIIKDIIINSDNKPMVFVLYDIDKFFDKPIVIRLIKDILLAIKNNYLTLIIISPNSLTIRDFENYVVFIKAGYPQIEEIIAIINDEIKNFFKNSKPVVTLDKINGKRFIESLKGLTEKQIRNIILKCLVEDGKLDFKDIRRIEIIKKEIYDRMGFLEYVEGESESNIAGFDNLKRWLHLRKQILYLDNFRDFPKGILITGIPGCGKSLASKVVGKILDYPIYRFDPSILYSKYIGETEENTRKVFDIVDKLSPICLWIDEIEKIFSPEYSSADGGVSKRVFSMFLIWMSERKNNTFVVATSNDINKLPPEFIRKGRFDEIFFADLPTLSERKEIFKIHLLKRGISLNETDIEKMALLSEGFSGSEIEQCIVSAFYSSGGKPNSEIIISEITKTTPLSVIKKSDFDFIRSWANERALVKV